MTMINLTEAQRELLIILAEECGEVVQRVTKLLRFGPISREPNSGEDNISLLEVELGDIHAMVCMLDLNEVIDYGDVSDAMHKKLDLFKIDDGRLRNWKDIKK